MTGRLNLTARPAAAAKPAGMSQQDKIKIGAAVGLLVVVGGWMCYYMGVFDFTSKPDPNVPIVDGKPLKKEEIQDHNEKLRQYKEQNDELTKKVGSPGQS